MGGFFAFPVIVSFAFMVLAIAKRGGRLNSALAACLAIGTLVVADFRERRAHRQARVTSATLTPPRLRPGWILPFAPCCVTPPHASCAVEPAVRRLVSSAPGALAATLLVLIALKAALAVDLVYDSLSYHIPFAALRAHMLTAWQFQRPVASISALTGYYDGFPMLADLIKGCAWRLTGWPEIVNLFALASLLAFLAYMRLAWGVRPAFVVIGLLAVPAIQTAAYGNYVDLPTSAAFAIMLFSICDLYLRPERFKRAGPWLVLFLSAVAAANIKAQASVLACLAMPFVLVPIWRMTRSTAWRDRARYGALFVAGALAIAVNLIKNLIYFGNPIYPLETTILGFHLPGPVRHDAWLAPIRPYARFPEIWQWLVSMLEFGGFGGRKGTYTTDMGDVPADSPVASMGGFFSGLVIASLAFFILAVAKRRDRTSYVLAACLAIMTLIVANFPNAHNLRYEMYWMMFLIVSCLMLLERAELADYLVSYRIVLFAALVFVTAVTGGEYLRPARMSIQSYVDASGTDALLRRVITGPGEIICLEQGGQFDQRMTILFAPIFHKELNAAFPYGVREGDCSGLKTIAGWN
jgi:hypothetical protein